jgi:hypothetical protein
LALFTVRRTRGFALAVFFVKAFCTAPAFAAIVPNVDPIDSATLVNIASSFDTLWLSTKTPLFARVLAKPLRSDAFPLP